MKILFLTQVIPFPPAGGEKLRSFGLLRSLGLAGHRVIAVTPSVHDPLAAEERLPHVHFISFDFPQRHSLPGQFAGYFTRDRKLAGLLRETLKHHRIDLAFIDYFFLGQYIGLFRDCQVPVIYGTHNAQSNLRLQQPARGIHERLVRAFSYLAQAWHERAYFRKADRLICVSDIDRQFYRRFIPEAQLEVIPNFIDESLYTVVKDKQPYIIMTGNFNSFQNFHGFSWFMREVWDTELAGITSLYLAGSGSEDALASLTPGPGMENVQAQDDPADFSALISAAAVAIVPLWHGSGTRLKCIEAMALKTQLVSTSIGAEGIAHQGSILIADTPDQFRQSIILALKKKVDTTSKAYDIFKASYSLEANSQKLEMIMKALVKKPE